MRKKIIIIIKEALEEFSDFFSLIEESNFLDLKIINYLELFSNKYTKLFEDTRLVNLIIVLHESFYKTVATELNEYLKRIYNIPFNNLLLIYRNNDFFQEQNLFSPSKHIFYLSRDMEFGLQINGFMLYIIKVFSESIISMRLHDYITDSFKGAVDAEILKKKNEEIKRLNNELNHLNEELVRKNKIDSLTQLYNRATIFDFLEKERIRTKRDIWRMDKVLNSDCVVKSGHLIKKTEGGALDQFLNHYGVLSLMLVDVDRFKNINDTHGHLTGDEVLHYLGELFLDKEIFRENDITGRWGGEEFLVILPDTNVNDAVEPADRFIHKLAKKEFTGTKGTPFKVTVSIGISQSSPLDQSKEDIIKRVDEALYWAKSNGRNRMAIFEQFSK